MKIQLMQNAFFLGIPEFGGLAVKSVCEPV
jgi:hypothetical protein